MMELRGIDVSVWNGNVDFNAVKNDNVNYVMIRTGFGSPSAEQVDKKYQTYLNGCRNAGIPTGAYHYGYATSVAEARTEAQFCLDILQGTDMPYGVWYDVEEKCMFNVGRQALTDIVNAFCEVIQNAGYKAGVYMSVSPAENSVDMNQIPYYKWIAQYNNTLQFNGHADIWQYADDGRVAGIPDNTVDMDYCYTDFGSDTGKTTEWVWYEDHQRWAYKRNGEWVYDEWFWDDEKQAWYYINKDGWMVVNEWIWDDNYKSWFYLNGDGKMQRGWFWDDKNQGWYHCKDDGKMSHNEWIWDEDKKAWYFLKDDGKMAVREWVQAPTDSQKYWVDENGKWVQ